ncbi:hypothetical protein EBQ81_00375 [bacterium]|nr:hypothetical protein [bacterium]
MLDEAVSSQENPTSPHALLEKVMKDKGITFEILKKKLIKEKIDNAENINAVTDIPKSKIFELIERIKKI